MFEVSASGAAFALAAAKGGTPAWVTSLIAAAAAISAALVTASSAAYVARRKVTELELSNSFQLAKEYLESARNYTQSVYLPLSVKIYALHNALLVYKAIGKPSERREVGKAWSPVERFENECRLFISAASELFAQGAGAVLTVRLDDDITAFISFLQESLTTKEVLQTRSLWERIIRIAISTAALILPGIGMIGSIPAAALIAFGTGSTADQEIASAPVTSDAFEKQFLLFISSIKLGIKQVTLGGYGDSSEERA